MKHGSSNVAVVSEVVVGYIQIFKGYQKFTFYFHTTIGMLRIIESLK